MYINTSDLVYYILRPGGVLWLLSDSVKSMCEACASKIHVLSEIHVQSEIHVIPPRGARW